MPVILINVAVIIWSYMNTFLCYLMKALLYKNIAMVHYALKCVEKKKLAIWFLSFLKTKMVQVVEILLREKQGPLYRS